MLAPGHQRPDTLMQDRTSRQLDQSSLATHGRTIHWVLVVRKRFQQERDASRPQPLSDGQVLSSLAVYSDWIASPVFVGATTVVRAAGRARPSSPPGAAGRP